MKPDYWLEHAGRIAATLMEAGERPSTAIDKAYRLTLVDYGKSILSDVRLRVNREMVVSGGSVRHILDEMEKGLNLG